MPDPRFARLATDPRFQRPRKLRSKVVVDDRFKEIFDRGNNERKTARTVDKYGRTLSKNHENDNLRRFYSLDETEKNDADPVEEVPRAPDYARGEVLLESSDESDAEKRDEDSPKFREPDGSRSPSEQREVDLEENDFADLDAQAAAYSRNVPDEDQQQEVTQTRRLAVVNLDWDHVKATHLFKIFSSLVSPTARTVAPSPAHSTREKSVKSGSHNVVRGRVLSVRVYPSEFGKEKLIQEEKEGPPVDVFKKKNQAEDEEVNEQNIYDVGDGDECDDDALRDYQLMRLRYYYAIVTCDTVEAASHIYAELEGTELERSANVFDLSFVPDDMSFDDDPRDEATEDQTSGYKGIDFVTTALRHSNVKLTWDEDDPERNQVTRRPLTRQEIEEADFKAYLASSTSGSDSEASQFHSRETTQRKDRRALSRDKLRALLLDRGDEELPEGWGRDADGGEDDVDMEITFTPALNDAGEGKDETTLEQYQRKMKEKRKKRKEQKGGNKAKTEEPKDDFFDEDESSGSQSEDLGRRSGKGQRGGKDVDDRDFPTASMPRTPITSEELALLVASDKPNAELKHFDLKSVLKAEKASKLKGKKRRKGPEEDDEIQDDFVINLKDDRFKSLHQDHAFAIDPSNPRFKKTKSMVALLEERSKSQKNRKDSAKASSKGENERAKNLRNLVESVKQKSAAAQQPGTGKRQKL